MEIKIYVKYGENFKFQIYKVCIEVLMFCLFLGGLTFVLLWFIGLWVWSVPILLVEYAVGRYTRKTVVQVFRHMVGPYAQWMGGFVAFVVLGIAYVELILWVTEMS